MIRRCLLATIACALLPFTAALAQPPGPSSFSFGKAGKIQKIANNMYVIRGGGGNTTVYVGDKGVVLVDVKVPGQGQAILDQVRTVTDKPILYVINTHEHFDHSGSNGFFADKALIVAQENCARSLAEAAKTPKQKKGVPDITYRSHMTLLDGAVQLYHFLPAHTGGDTFVYFPEEQVLATGDVFPGKSQPIIDTQHGGSGLNFPKVLAEALHTFKNAEVVVPGHSTVMTRKDLKEYQAFNALFVNAARKAFKAGETPVEAMTELKQTIPARFKNYRLGAGMLTGPGGNFGPIFKELKAQQAQ